MCLPARIPARGPPSALVAVPCRVVLWTDDKTATLLGAAVDSLNDVYQFLFVLEDEVEFVIVAGAEIDHHVLVSEEEHYCAGVVEFVLERGC